MRTVPKMEAYKYEYINKCHILKYPNGEMKIYGRFSFIKKDTSAYGSSIIRFPIAFKTCLHVNVTNVYSFSNSVCYSVSPASDEITVHYVRNSGVYVIGETVDFYLEATGTYI